MYISRELSWIESNMKVFEKLLMGFRACYPKCGKTAKAKVSISFSSLLKQVIKPSCPSLEEGHKAFIPEVPSLYPEERNVLISEDTGRQKGIWTTPPFITMRSYPFIFQSHFYRTVQSSSNLCIKMHSLHCFFELSFMKASVSHKTYVK